MSPLQIKLAIYAVLALLALGAGTAVVLTYKHAIVRAETAETKAKAAEALAKGWQSESETTARETEREHTLFAMAKDQQLVAATRQLGQFKSELEHLRSVEAGPAPDRDGRCPGFLDTPLPDSVRRLRRERFGCTADPSVPCPGVPPPLDGGATNERPGRGGSSNRSPGIADFFTGLQR